MAIILWFDDGLIDTYTRAFPTMQKYGFRGVCSVITGRVGNVWADVGWRNKQLMNLEQLTELHDAGWDINSHGKSHFNFDALDGATAQMELIDSRDWLVTHGFESWCFAWPFGISGNYDGLALNVYEYIRKTGETYWDGKEKVFTTTIAPNHEWHGSVTTWVDDVCSRSKELGQHAVILNHGIRRLDEERDPWELTPEEFESELLHIANSGAKVKTVRDIVGQKSGTQVFVLGAVAAALLLVL